MRIENVVLIFSYSDLSPRDVAVIREVYDNDNCEEIFQMELEKALQVGCRTIIIEPSGLGRNITWWISLGRLIKKVSLGAGLATLIIGQGLSDWPILTFPLGLTSGFCWGLYYMNWQSDPCSQYQVETKKKNLSRTSLNTITSLQTIKGPVILIKTPSRTGDFFSCALALCALGYSIWKLKSS